MINKVNFGLRLKQLRERKRLSQIELANILEVSNGSISKWERNERQPDYETLEKIADFFNTSIVSVISSLSFIVYSSYKNKITYTDKFYKKKNKLIFK